MSSPPLLRHVVFAGGFLLFCHVPVAHAANALVVDQRGPGAAAFFSTFDATGCVSTAAFVVASDLSERTIPGDAVGAAQVAVVVSQIDLCTLSELLVGNGVTTDAVVRVAPNLDSATVSAVVPVLNLANGILVNVSVDLTFFGTSQIQADAGESLNVGISGFRINTVFHQTFRAASAAGVIATDEAVVVSGSSVDGMIQNLRAGTVVVSTN